MADARHDGNVVPLWSEKDGSRSPRSEERLGGPESGESTPSTCLSLQQSNPLDLNEWSGGRRRRALHPYE